MLALLRATLLARSLALASLADPPAGALYHRACQTPLTRTPAGYAELQMVPCRSCTRVQSPKPCSPTRVRTPAIIDVHMPPVAFGLTPPWASSQ